MPPSTEKTTRQSRAEKKTRSLIGREAQLRHFRRSDLAKDTTNRIILHTKLARRHYPGKSGDGAWNRTKKTFSAAEKRRKLTQKRRRRRDKALVPIVKEIRRAQEEASQGTYAHRIACFRRIEHARGKKKAMKFKPHTSPVMESESIPNQRRAASASLPKRPTVLEMLQTARSVSHLQPTTEHIAHSNDSLRNRSHPRVPGAITGPVSDFETASSSEARQKLSSLPSYPSGFVIPIESIPAWAHWYEPPLSAAQVDHVRNRMKPPEEYLSMGPSQSEKCVTQDLSEALRSMCQTFNQSVKLIGKHAGKLKQEFLRPRGETVAKDKNARVSVEDKTIDPVPSIENNKLTGIWSGNAAGLNIKTQAPFSLSLRPSRANGTYSDNTLLSNRAEDGDHAAHERRKTFGSSFRQIQFGHHGDIGGEGSPDAVHIPKRDLSRPSTDMQRSKEPHKEHASKKRKRYISPELLEKQLSARPPSFSRHTTGAEQHDLSLKNKPGSLFDATSDGHDDSERQERKEKLIVNIPADTDMATDARAYTQWPDDSGALKNAQGCLLPAMYRFSGLPGFEWICPVRTCRRCFQSQNGLGSHFVASHRSCLLNDNRDGTFTILEKTDRLQNGDRRPALVKSKNPLPKNAPPIAEPRPPVRWASVEQEQLFAAGRKKARSRPAPDCSEENTVDEMMLHSGCVVLSPARISSSSELIKLSRTPSPRDIEEWSYQPEASSSKDSSPPIKAESHDEGTIFPPGLDRYKHAKASHPPRDATEENWRIVKGYITGIQFYPSKRGQFAALLSTPRIRNLATRPGVRYIADQPKKIHLLIVHMSGTEPSVTCDSCAMGRGPFEKCVAISQKAAGEITNGVVCCTNCASKRSLQQRCNLEALPNKQAIGQIHSQRQERKEHLSPEPREQASLGISPYGFEIEIDSRFKRTDHPLPRDSSLVLNAEPSCVRLCSPTMGKVLVELEGNSPFLMGPHGMFTLMPAMSAEVSNASEVDAVLIVYTVKS